MLILCKLCGGKIGQGEPVVTVGDGLAHRFRATCEYERDKSALQAHSLGVLAEFPEAE